MRNLNDKSKLSNAVSKLRVHPRMRAFCYASKLHHSMCYRSQRNVLNRYIWLPLLRLNPLTKGFPLDNLRKILSVNG